MILISKKRSKVTNEEIELMVKLYNEGYSAAAICKHLPYTPHTIIDHLRDAGVSIRSKAGAKTPLNDSYFETIDSEEKAYFLGFLMADGCVSERYHSQPAISLQLHSDDEYILHRLKEETESGVNITYLKSRNHSSWRVHSKKMATDLAKYGIVPRKTGHECLPIDMIPDNLIRHFIRGFFDGDGWFSVTSCHGIPNGRISLGFVSNINMLISIKEYLNKNISNLTDIKIHEYSDTDKGYTGFSMMLYAKLDNVKDIGNFLYEDATIYLERKYNTFTNAISLISSRRKSKRPCNA